MLEILGPQMIGFWHLIDQIMFNESILKTLPKNWFIILLIDLILFLFIYKLNPNSSHVSLIIVTYGGRENPIRPIASNRLTFSQVCAVREEKWIDQMGQEVLQSRKKI